MHVRYSFFSSPPSDHPGGGRERDPDQGEEPEEGPDEGPGQPVVGLAGPVADGVDDAAEQVGAAKGGGEDWVPGITHI